MSFATALLALRDDKAENKTSELSRWEKERTNVQQKAEAFIDAKRTSDLILADKNKNYDTKLESLIKRSITLGRFESAVKKAKDSIPKDGQTHIEKYRYIETKEVDLYLAKLALAYDQYRAAKNSDSIINPALLKYKLEDLKALIDHPYDHKLVLKAIEEFYQPVFTTELELITSSEKEKHNKASEFAKQISVMYESDRIIIQNLLNFLSKGTFNSANEAEKPRNILRHG